MTNHLLARSGIKHKLSFVNTTGDIFRQQVKCNFVVLFNLVHVLGKVRNPALGTSLWSNNLFMGQVIKFQNATTLLNDEMNHSALGSVEHFLCFSLDMRHFRTKLCDEIQMTKERNVTGEKTWDKQGPILAEAIASSAHSVKKKA